MHSFRNTGFELDIRTDLFILKSVSEIGDGIRKIEKALREGKPVDKEFVDLITEGVKIAQHTIPSGNSSYFKKLRKTLNEGSKASEDLQKMVKGPAGHQKEEYENTLNRIIPLFTSLSALHQDYEPTLQ